MEFGFECEIGSKVLKETRNEISRFLQLQRCILNQCIRRHKY
ncbi:unnamed protein product [Larinioides sclopetarius]|uniref:Uncharacterized protein n=1 Tax=Larinioides sclopetarius TaxID=280406 RepID=A0AAV1Z0X7_9ARAC